LEICELFDINERSNKDSLLKYALLAEDLAQDIGDGEKILLAKIHFAQAHSFTDSTIYFTVMSDVRDAYLNKQEYLNAAEQETEMAKYHMYNLDMESLRSHLMKALKILSMEGKREKEHYNLESLVLYYIANSYNYGDSYESALSYALKMKNIAEEHLLEKRILMSYLLLGNIYASLDKNIIVENNYADQAKGYLTKAYQGSLESEEIEIQYGASYQLGEFLYIQGDYSAAIPLFEASLSIISTIGNSAYEFNNTIYLGRSYLGLGDIPRALSQADKAHDIANDYNMSVNIRSVDMLYATIYNQSKDYATARKYALQALNHPSTNLNLELKVVSLRLLEEIEYGNGNYKKSRDYDKLADRAQDSLLNIKTLSNVNLLQSKYDLKAQEDEVKRLQDLAAIEKLKSQNKLIRYSGLFIALLAGLIGYLLFQHNQKEKKEMKLLALEQKLLRSQMNPHFIFNAISSIQNFLYDKKDLSTAINYMAKFGRLMRQVLENSREEYISLEEEINSLTNYLDMQLLRYNQSFDYKINVASDLDSNLLLVPPLITQPFVENAIEHGMIYNIEGGKVTIDVTHEKEELILAIQDNGVANRVEIDDLKVPLKKKKSLAAIITQERLNHISQNHKRKYMLSTQLLKDGGMMVNINLPLVRVL
jgi:tetratricopeptide (TPR) repeat protein